MENRIYSFVIAIVNTTDFLGYVHEMPNCMTVGRININALKPRKGGKIYKIEIVVSVI